MAKTMTVVYTMAQPSAAVYQTIVASQLAYFKDRNAGIHELTVGTSVATTLHTKTDQMPVAATMTVTQLEADHVFETKVTYAAGQIVTTYQLAKATEGTKVTYSETNTFNKKSFANSFWVVGWVYTLFYRRNIKKRLQWIEETAALSKVGESNGTASH